jgi:anti-anti-sigma factor
MAKAADTPHAQLRIARGPDGVLHVAGELDLASAPQLRSALQEQVDGGAARCVLDLTDLTFCDSTGLTILIWAHHAFADGAVLHRPSPQLSKILRTTGLDQVFKLDQPTPDRA